MVTRCLTAIGDLVTLSPCHPVTLSLDGPQRHQRRLLRLSETNSATDAHPLVGPVATELRQLRARSAAPQRGCDIPQRDPAALAAARQQRAVGAPRYRAHLAGVATQNHALCYLVREAVRSGIPI